MLERELELLEEEKRIINRVNELLENRPKVKTNNNSVLKRIKNKIISILNK